MRNAGLYLRLQLLLALATMLGSFAYVATARGDSGLLAPGGTVNRVIRGTATFSAGSATMTIGFSPSINPAKAVASASNSVLNGSGSFCTTGGCYVIVTGLTSSQLSVQRESGQTYGSQVIDYEIVEYQ